MLAALIMMAGCASTVAKAQETITLFGQSYSVQRFDYSQQVQLPNAVFPEDGPIPFIESEGAIWIGNNKLLMSADDIFDISPGNADNWIVEVRLVTNESGVISGLEYSRTIISTDSSGAFDINPSGLTVNTGSGGLGKGGNVILASGGGNLFSYSLQPGSEGQLLGLDGLACASGLGACRISMGSQNVNLEDVTYVPLGPSGQGEFYAINQDTTAVERWAVNPSSGVTGQRLASIPVGLSLSGQPPLHAPKGLVYLPDVDTVPSAIRAPGGSFVVAFDDLYPALQVFDLAGQLLAIEFLTEDGTAGGAPRLDTSGCGDPLQLESLTIDPATGRLFLVNQGALTLCNFMYILTPVADEVLPCSFADYNLDGGVDGADVEAFFVDWEVSVARADVNLDGGIDGADIEAFFIAWESGGC